MKNLFLYLPLLFCSLFSLKTFAQNSLEFDGVNDRVDLGNVYNFEITDTFSVEAWVRLDPGNDNCQIISKYDGNNRGWGFQIFASPNFHPFDPDGGLGVYLADNLVAGNTIFVVGTTDVRDGLWHHVAFSYDGSATPQGIRIYLDGIEEITNDLGFTLNPGATMLNNATAQIGSLHYGGSNIELMNGNIDELRIWGHERSLSHFQQHINHEYCGFTGLMLGYYQFNEGIANANNIGVNALPDYTGFGNNGTLVNFSLNGVASNWVTGQTLDMDIEISNVARNLYTVNISKASYQWIDCDNGGTPIVGATTKNFTPSTSGNYAVEVVFYGCTLTSPCRYLTASNVVFIPLLDYSFDDLSETEIALEVFPNPVQDAVNIKTSSQSGNIHIYNAQGKLVHQQITDGQQTIQIDMKQMTSGIYIVNFQSENGVIRTEKIIKN